MIGRLILIVVQVAAGWWLAPLVMAKSPIQPTARFSVFAYAVLFALIVWLIGFIGALALKDVAQPSVSTLTVALVGALIGAGLTMVPEVTRTVTSVVKGVSNLAYPLLGAVLGYAIKR